MPSGPTIRTQLVSADGPLPMPVEVPPPRLRRAWRRVRHSFAICSVAVSIAACASVAGMWRRSYSVYEAWTVVLEPPPAQQYYARVIWIGSYRGRILIEITSVGGDDASANLQWRITGHEYAERPAVPRIPELARSPFCRHFGVEPLILPHTNDAAFSRQAGAVGARYWQLAAVGIVPGAALGLRRLIRQRRAARRKVAFRCSGCGYDLRATPQRCPECGLTPEKGDARRAADAAVVASRNMERG